MSNRIHKKKIQIQTWYSKILKHQETALKTSGSKNEYIKIKNWPSYKHHWRHKISELIFTTFRR